MPCRWRGIPALARSPAAVNNDNLAFLGGAAATLGVWQLVATRRGGWLAVALAGVIAAGWAKLTGLVLTGAWCRSPLPISRGAVACRGFGRLRFCSQSRSPPRLNAIYLLQYGSPTPETPAQIALITDGARAAGWADLRANPFPTIWVISLSR